jgi:small-conductance mechanosensitive channel
MADSDWVVDVQHTVRDWTWPACILVGGVLFGWALERVVVGRLKHWAEHAQWRGPEVIARAARGMVFLWVAMVTLVIATHTASAPIALANRAIIEHLIQVLWVISGTMVAARALSGFLAVQISHLPGVGSTTILANVVTILVYLMGALVVLDTQGIPIAPMLTALGVGGLAVALALQDTLSNLFAGIHILMVRQVRVNDWIRLDTGDEGAVVDVGWRNTTVRTLLNNLVVIPNAKLAGAVVTNFSLPEKHLVIRVKVGVSYDSDLEQVEATTLEVARQLLLPAGDDARFEPQVRFHTLGDWSVDFDVLLPIPDFQDQNLIRHRFLKALVARYRAERIDIPYPVQAHTELRPGGAAPAGA